MKRPVTIYVEMTPNPNTMKFVVDHMLVDPGQVVEFLNRQEAVVILFSRSLIQFPFGIFIANNFNGYKNDSIEWSDISLELREFIETG